MDLPVRKKLPHTVPQRSPSGSWFFITINCVPPRRNQLACAGVGDAVLAAMRFNHDNRVWHCRLCLLMPDHLHAILAFPEQPGLAAAVTNWKKFIAARQGVRWQRDFFDHRLRNPQELEEKTCYILENPVRKGLCDRAGDWPWICRPGDRPPPSSR